MNKDQQSDILVQFLCLFSTTTATHVQSAAGPTAFLILHYSPTVPLPTFLYLTICWHALFAAGRNLYLLCELIWVCLKYFGLDRQFAASVVASMKGSHEET